MTASDGGFARGDPLTIGGARAPRPCQPDAVPEDRAAVDADPDLARRRAVRGRRVGRANADAARLPSGPDGEDHVVPCADRLDRHGGLERDSDYQLRLSGLAAYACRLGG